MCCVSRRSRRFACSVGLYIRRHHVLLIGSSSTTYVWYGIGVTVGSLSVLGAPFGFGTTRCSGHR